MAQIQPKGPKAPKLEPGLGFRGLGFRVSGLGF